MFYKKNSARENLVRKLLKESASVKIKTAKMLAEKIAEASEIIIAAYERGNKLILAGNGGSAADAQHIAAELVGRFKKERRALPAIALSVNTSVLTALGNDYGYAAVFARQIEAFAEEGDVFLAISTSGESQNILRAIMQAQKLKVTTIGLSGKGGGTLKDIAGLALVVPSDDIQRIQEAHIAIGHIICEIIEEEMFPGDKKYKT